jgi:type II secretory ATPase GspE/PulE/Tfp pilus assembly ATPase PilB-like protein
MNRKELEHIVKSSGKFVSLAENCHRLVLEGVTTIEEARRTINSADL